MSHCLLLLLSLLPAFLAISLSERVDELDEKSLDLVTKARFARKLTRDLRTELVTFFLDFVQLHAEVLEDGDPVLLFKKTRKLFRSVFDEKSRRHSETSNKQPHTVQLTFNTFENVETLLRLAGEITQVSRIAARLRAGLRVGLPHVKKRLSKVVSGLLAPLFFPFYLMEETNNPVETTPVPVQPPFYYSRQFSAPFSSNQWEIEYPYR